MRHQGGEYLCFKHHSILAALRAQPFDLEEILFSKPTVLCLFGFASPQVGFVQSSWILFVDFPLMHTFTFRLGSNRRNCCKWIPACCKPLRTNLSFIYIWIEHSALIRLSLSCSDTETLSIAAHGMSFGESFSLWISPMTSGTCLWFLLGHCLQRVRHMSLRYFSLICSTSCGRRPDHVGRVGFIVWTFLVLFGSLSCCHMLFVDVTKFHLSFLDLRCHFVNSLRWLSIGFCFVTSMDFLSPSLWTSVGFCSPISLKFIWIFGVNTSFHCPWLIGCPGAASMCTGSFIP